MFRGQRRFLVASQAAIQTKKIVKMMESCYTIFSSNVARDVFYMVLGKADKCASGRSRAPDQVVISQRDGGEGNG